MGFFALRGILVVCQQVIDGTTELSLSLILSKSLHLSLTDPHPSPLQGGFSGDGLGDSQGDFKALLDIA